MVIIDQLRRLLEPYRLWQPPLTQPRRHRRLVTGWPPVAQGRRFACAVFLIGITIPYTTSHRGRLTRPGANVTFGRGSQDHCVAARSAVLTPPTRSRSVPTARAHSTALTTVSAPTWARRVVRSLRCADGNEPRCWCASASSPWNEIQVDGDTRRRKSLAGSRKALAGTDDGFFSATLHLASITTAPSRKTGADAGNVIINPG